MSSAAEWRWLVWPAEPPVAAVDGAWLPAEFCLTVSCSCFKACSCVSACVWPLQCSLLAGSISSYTRDFPPAQPVTQHSLPLTWVSAFTNVIGMYLRCHIFITLRWYQLLVLKDTGERKSCYLSTSFPWSLFLAGLSGETVFPVIHLIHLFYLSIELTYRTGGSTAETIPKRIGAYSGWTVVSLRHCRHIFKFSIS